MSAHTPDRWRWEVNANSRVIQLCGGRGFDLTVLDFVRWGMSGAAPRFRTSTNLMVRGDEFAVKAAGREHHRDWFQLLQHPDAVLIQSAPELLSALRRALSRCSNCGTCGPARCPECEADEAVVKRATGGEP